MRSDVRLMVAVFGGLGTPLVRMESLQVSLRKQDTSGAFTHFVCVCV